MMLKVEFEEAVWVKVVDMLSTQPYKDAGPVIAALAQQFQAQKGPDKPPNDGNIQ